MLALLKHVFYTLTQPAYLPANLPSLSARHSFWIWTKLVLLFALVGFFFLLASSVYLTPQLPKILSEKIPFSHMALQSGRLSSDLASPLVFSSLLLDPHDSISHLDASPSGFYFFSDHFIAKNGSDLQSQAYPKDSSFSLSKADLISYLTAHQSQVLLFLGAAAALIILVNFFFYWLFQLAFVLIWSFGTLLILKLRHSPITFSKLLILSFHASLAPLLVSVSTFFVPSLFTAAFNIFIFAFLFLRWLTLLQSSPLPTTLKP